MRASFHFRLQPKHSTISTRSFPSSSNCGSPLAMMARTRATSERSLVVTVTLYTFEDEYGEPDTFITDDPKEAKARGEQYAMAVYANEYEYADRELVWDFTEEVAV